MFRGDARYRRMLERSVVTTCLKMMIQWREPSRLEWIREGLVDLVCVLREHRIASVAIPAPRDLAGETAIVYETLRRDHSSTIQRCL
jgi:hypothetical protein